MVVAKEEKQKAEEEDLDYIPDDEAVAEEKKAELEKKTKDDDRLVSNSPCPTGLVLCVTRRQTGE